MKKIDYAIKVIKWIVYIMAGGVAAALLLMVGLWLHSYISPWVLGSGMTTTGLYMLYVAVVVVAVVFVYDRKCRSGEERLGERIKDELAIIRSKCPTTKRLKFLYGKTNEELQLLEEMRRPGEYNTIQYCLAYEKLYCRHEAIKNELKSRGAFYD